MYELCLPYTLSHNEKLKRCQAFYGVTNIQSSGTCEYDDLAGYSSLSVFIIGLLFIIVIVFSITVIYYNIYVIISNSQLTRHNTPPFIVPGILPEFLFPRYGNNQQRTTVDRNLDRIFENENKNNFFND